MQRAPIVVILGHVDHGKTTLLDALWKSHITKKEIGGITQSIGAFQIAVGTRRLTLIDTPGHEAFSAMRAQGANVADVAVLVVAADDGVKPQTVEALAHIRSAGIPMVVAINKIDVHDANSDRVRVELVKHGCLVEGYGGTVPTVEISALKGTNLRDLLDVIFLVYDIEERNAPSGQSVYAPVIESTLDRRVGPLVAVVVREGTIQEGDKLYAGSLKGKARALINDRGQRVSCILPGEPAQIVGFPRVVPIGTVVTAHPLQVSLPSKHPLPLSRSAATPPLSGNGPPAVILKADSQGTLHALSVSFGNDVIVVYQGVGNITASDVFLAESSRAAIIGFRVSVPSSVRTLAELYRVSILTNDVIYQILDAYRQQRGKQTVRAAILGKATIMKVFTVSGAQIAGCRVTEGRLAVNDRVRIEHGSVSIDAAILQLKQAKLDTEKVEAGEECGVLLKFPHGTPLKPEEGSAIIAIEKDESIQ